MMRNEYFPFYYLRPRSQIYKDVIRIKYRLEGINRNIKSYKNGQDFDIEDIKYSLGEIFNIIYNYLNEKVSITNTYNGRILKQLVMTIYHFPHYILSLMDFINDE